MQLGLLLAKGVRIKVQAPYWRLWRQLQGQEGLFSSSGLEGVLSKMCRSPGQVCTHRNCTNLCSWSDGMGFPGCIWWAP